MGSENMQGLTMLRVLTSDARVLISVDWSHKCKCRTTEIACLIPFRHSRYGYTGTVHLKPSGKQ